MGSDYEEEIKKISYDDILSYTGNLSPDNKIGKFQFGEVYRGKMGEKVVTVKIWRKTRSLYICYAGHNETRLLEEIQLQTYGGLKSHRHIVRVIAYCDEGENRLGVVYNLNPLDTLQNLMVKDNLTWLQRIKVAYQLAAILKFLHNAPLENGKRPYLVLNLNPAHIMIEQDYTPILYDFSMFSGGILQDRSRFKHYIVPGCFGYIDPSASIGGRSYTTCDVFAFGVILLSLIVKKVFIAEDHIDKNGKDEYVDVLLQGAGFLNLWAQEEYGKCVAKYGKGNVSLVHQSFGEDQDFDLADGPKITDVVMECLIRDFSERPFIEEVIDLMDGLLVVQRHPDILGIGTNGGHERSHDEASEVDVQ